MTDEELNKYANSIYIEPSSFEYFKKQISEAVEKDSIEFHKWVLPAKVKMYQDIAGKENEKEEYLKLKNMAVEELYKIYLQDQNKKLVL